ncbi:MAG: ubiquinol-cytochrome c reductase iron-sulfur subunit [Acidobacteriaceae bacterium]|nr:ubiquinol-cytochrome c reductase iron-sulfur subunit [Acidobacteriaceae bacterium]MBV9778513.1 ubiquinol-cytochrome c reductase iron-sulfur subunit [Acidobacteriaceae bacterium]
MSPPELKRVAVAEPTRRSYLGWLLGLCTAGAGVALSVPLIRFLLYPLRARTTEVKWSDAGAVSDFASLTGPVQRSITVEQVDGWRKTVSDKIVYITKSSSGELEVLSAVCPHLGCSVQWRDSKHGFECPCHAASFRPDGSITGGPAPRAMDTLQTQIQNGRLMVRYQYFRQLVATKEVFG